MNCQYLSRFGQISFVRQQPKLDKYPGCLVDICLLCLKDEEWGAFADWKDVSETWVFVGCLANDPIKITLLYISHTLVSTDMQ